MANRKLPERGTPEAQWFLEQWDNSTAQQKKQLCNIFDNVSYDRAKHMIMEYRSISLPSAPTAEEMISTDFDIPWAEQIEVFKNMDRLVSLHMQTPIEVIIEIKTDFPIASVKTADWHIGQPGVDYDQFKSDMEFIRDEPNIYCDVGGDGYQNIIQPSKVGSSHNQQPISPQRGLFVLTLKELIDKIKVLRTGNHNYWSTLAVGEDWENELARRLKILYMKHYGVIHWKIGDMIYTELAMHKSSFNSSFNLTHTCKQYQRLYCPKARIITVEHHHIAAIEQYRYDDKECVAIRTGTYAIYDDYAQQNGFFGAHVANPTVIMFPHEDKIVGFKDMRDAAIYLKAIRNSNGD